MLVMANFENDFANHYHNANGYHYHSQTATASALQRQWESEKSIVVARSASEKVTNRSRSPTAKRPIFNKLTSLLAREAPLLYHILHAVVKRKMTLRRKKKVSHTFTFHLLLSQKYRINNYQSNKGRTKI